MFSKLGVDLTKLIRPKKMQHISDMKPETPESHPNSNQLDPTLS